MMKKRSGQMRILEAFIACGLILMAYAFLSKSNTIVATQENSGLQSMSANLLNVLQNQELLMNINPNNIYWKTQLAEIVRSVIPPNVYYNITFQSLVTNKTIGEPVTNIDDTINMQQLNANSIYGIYSYSYPVLQKTDTPLDVIMVMDRSGSMSWYIPGDSHPKIYYTKISAKNFIDRMNSTIDKAGLSSFATDSKLDIGLTSSYSIVKSKIDSLIASGSTNMMGGIKKANAEFQTNGRSEAVKVMIILTDGVANWWDGNTGGQNEQLGSYYAQQQADIAKNAGTKIFTIGLGDPSYLNETLLKNIQTDGYFRAPSAQDLERIYQSIADKIMSEVKYDVIGVQVELMKPIEGLTK